jgi:hypothetical protein
MKKKNRKKTQGCGSVFHFLFLYLLFLKKIYIFKNLNNILYKQQTSTIVPQFTQPKEKATNSIFDSTSIT